MTKSLGTPLTRDLEVALELIVRAPTLLVALDFDGTLAPSADDPLAVRAHPAVLEPLERLRAMPATPLALISGRAMDSLEHVAQAPADVVLSGSHGAEFRLGGEYSAPTLTPEQHDVLAKLETILRGIAETAEGAWVEVKAVGFALHTRMASVDDASRVERLAREATAALPRLTVREGKNVIEFSVVAATKSDAVRWLREHTAATAVLFAGDDVTDEDGFAALESTDIGIKVGAGPTLARYRVESLESMPIVLRTLADLRAATV